MPRKTGYKTRSASSTLVLGDPNVGTKAWDTEYDVEFTEAPRREAQERQFEAKASARASLRTPRSLKKGYVSGQDYEELDEHYGQALSAYRDLQAQVGALELRISCMKTNEHELLRAVEEQQGLLETLRQQVAAMAENLGLLLGGAERNKSLLSLMTNIQQETAGPQAEIPAGIARRLSSLEDKIGDMAEAVAALSRAQALMAAPAASQPASPDAGLHGHGHGGRTSLVHQQSATRRDSVRRDSALMDRGRTSEKIERLPNPIQLVTRRSSWKP